MQELIRNAWLGWKSYTDDGKLAALFLAALLLLWLWESKDGKNKIRNKYCRILSYTTVLGICCICPITAAALMMYQTQFYDYQWIWNLVPVTIVIALAGTLLWTALVGMPEKNPAGNPQAGKRKVHLWKVVGITALMSAILYLCGSMQMNSWDMGEEAAKREKTAYVLENLTENGQNESICLWAPQEIMEYARALDGRITLPYGRNMWDAALNAYAYDTYSEVEGTLYEWMSYAEETGESAVAPDICMTLAHELGVNCILLPEKLQPEVLKEMENAFGAEAESLGEFYLLRIA